MKYGFVDFLVVAQIIKAWETKNNFDYAVFIWIAKSLNGQDDTK